LQWSPELIVLLAASLALALVSLWDDYIDLPAGGRLITHLTVVGVFLASTLNMGEGWSFALSMLIAIAWMTNLFNFMDGADGLAGGMALFGFAAYAWLAWLGGNLPLMFLCGSVSSAALAFLIFNFPPARLFMGDAGSVPLGFLAGAIGMFGWREGLWHGLVPVLVFSPFIIDATVTLLRRGLAGEKVWKAHRSHYYQRLVRMGWSHRRLAMSAFALMAMTAMSGVLSEWNNELKRGVVIVWGVFYCVVMVTIDQRWRRASGEI
jgi:UDP-GlcNAc:undecaprenyl-phosphate GlcNAc-1-phosphate transferase